ASATNLRILASGALTARGTLGVSLLSLEGPLDMGPTPARLFVDGNLSMGSGASARMRIGLKASGVWDTLAVSGPALFDGVLNLRSIFGNFPAVGDTIPIATYGSLVHAFSSVTLDGLPASGKVALVYEANVLKVVIIAPVTGVSDGDARPAAGAAPR